MKILHLTPGTGSFHCGSCLRDNALILALRARGHDAMIAPLYLPMVTDAEDAGGDQPVRVGGVGLYLQQKLPWFRLAPRFMHRLLDHPALLRWASRRMGLTGARDLGEMTVGSLLGEESPQWPEWEKLVRWVIEDCRPDVVVLSNALLMGLANPLSRMQMPVVCSLQGEDGFLDTLVDPYRARAWELIHRTAAFVTRFAAPSGFYAELMARRMDVDLGKITVVPNGLNFDAYQGERRDPPAPTIGFLARMIHGKGLTTLVDAFIRLVRDGRIPDVRLRIAGAATSSDEPYIEGLKQKLAEAGVAQRVTWEPNLTFADKVKFLHEIDLFSVPATCGEAFGMYVIEAQACGVPVVQPRHGAFPELLAATAGGILCEPDDAQSLATSLGDLLADSARRQQLAAAARTNTREYYSAGRMAERFESTLQGAVGGSRVPG